MSKLDFSFIGFARTFAKERGGSKSWELGNCSAANLKATPTKRALKNFKTGQGNINSSTRVESVAFDMTMHDIEKDNLAMLAYGTANSVVAGTVTDEPIIGKIGGLSRTAQINISAVVVTDSPMTQTYVEGTDYEVTNAGISVLAGGSIADDDALLIDYSYSAAEEVEGLTEGAKEYEITVVGINDAQNGKPYVLDLFIVKPGFFEELAFISEDYAAPKITGELTADSTKSGVGISQYFKYAYVA